MDVTTRGLVLRAVQYREADKILTVLTEDLGKVTVSARGARRKQSKLMACTQLLSFSELTLYERQGRWYLREGLTISLFETLQRDLVRLSLGTYFAEVLEAVAMEGSPDPELLTLGLLALFYLSREDRDPALVKAAFELRLMCLTGYAPELSGCGICGAPPGEAVLLSLRGGHLQCPTCKGEGLTLPLCASSLAAVRHVAGASVEKVFSFTLRGDAVKRFGDAAEVYLLTQLERGFRTLDFYKQLT